MEKSEMKEYLQFLETKRKEAINAGIKVSDKDLNPKLFPFQKYCVRRALCPLALLPTQRHRAEINNH